MPMKSWWQNANEMWLRLPQTQRLRMLSNYRTNQTHTLHGSHSEVRVFVRLCIRGISVCWLWATNIFGHVYLLCSASLCCRHRLLSVASCLLLAISAPHVPLSPLHYAYVAPVAVCVSMCMCFTDFMLASALTRSDLQGRRRAHCCYGCMLTTVAIYCFYCCHTHDSRQRQAEASQTWPASCSFIISHTHTHIYMYVVGHMHAHTNVSLNSAFAIVSAFSGVHTNKHTYMEGQKRQPQTQIHATFAAKVVSFTYAHMCMCVFVGFCICICTSALSSAQLFDSFRV